MRKTLPIILLILGWNVGLAQFSNRKCLWITEFNQVIKLDSLSVEPSSINTSSPISFSFDINTNSLNVRPSESLDSVEVCYRVFPFNFSEPHSTHTFSEYDSTVASRPIIIPNSYNLPQREELFTVEGIQKTGSIS